MSILGVKLHKGAINKIVRDDRLGPNRRLLAELISLYLSSDGEERAFIASVILGEFVNRNGFKLYGTDNQLTVKEGSETKLELAAMQNIKSAFQAIKEGMKEEGLLPNDTVQS